MARGRSYDYTPPSYEETVQRAEQKGSYDSILKDAKPFKPAVGVNLVRLLPPGWKGAKHYGLHAKVHRNVGPNDRQYLCNRENDTSPYDRCPVCEELYNLGSRATADDKRDLRTNDVVFYYLIDRDHEKEGVLVWTASGQADSEIAAQSVNHRAKSVLDIAHPDDGYDLEFTRTGTTRFNTRYKGYKISRESSPLSESQKRMDEWLDTAFEKPLTSLLNFYTPEYIEKVFYGKPSAKDDAPKRRIRDEDDEDDVEEKPLTRRRPRDEDEEEKPTRRVRDEEEEEKPARSRSRVRDDEEEEAPSRSRRAAPDEEEEKPARRARDEEEEEKPTRTRRTALSEDLDDEIPSESGRRARPNGRATEEEDEPVKPARRPRERLEDDEPGEKPVRSRTREEPEERPARARSRVVEEEETERPARRRREVEEEEEKPVRRSRDEEDEHETRRERVRDRLARE